MCCFFGVKRDEMKHVTENAVLKQYVAINDSNDPATAIITQVHTSTHAAQRPNNLIKQEKV